MAFDIRRQGGGTNFYPFFIPLFFCMNGFYTWSQSKILLLSLLISLNIDILGLLRLLDWQLLVYLAMFIVTSTTLYIHII